MKPDLFSIGPLTVHGYGLCIAVGIIVAYMVGEYRAKKRNMSVDTLFNLVMCVAIFGILGAKVMFIIVEIKQIIHNPKMLLDIAHGFVVYGGLIAGILAGAIFCKVKKLVWREWFDLVLPEVALAQAFGRMGCFMAGCCYGAETTSWFHIVFKESYLAPNNVWLIPTQLISVFLNILNWVVLTFVAPKIIKKKGFIAPLFLINYSVGRFVLEFFRGDAARGQVGILSTSQFISCFIFLAGVALFIILNLTKNNNDTGEGDETEVSEKIDSVENTAE